MSIAAEDTYLFRHAVLRDAAYQLMTPEIRVDLHAWAFRLVESAHGGPPPEPPPLSAEDARYEPHPIDAIAAKLVEHIEVALSVTQFDSSLIQARISYLRRAAEHAGRHFQNEEALQHWTRLAALVHGADEGACWRRAGSIAYHTGHPQGAADYWAKSLEVLQQTNDRRAIGGALSNLGVAKNRLGEKQEAEELFNQALAIHRETGNRKFEANTCHALGGLYLVTNRFEEAQQMLRTALEINRELGNRAAEGMVLSSLALIHERNDDLALATQAYAEALAIHEDTNRVWLGITLGNFALLKQREDKFEECAEMLTQALAINREVGNRSSEGMTMGNFANLYVRTERNAEAERAYKQALGLLRETGNLRGEGAHTCSYALLMLRQGRVENAREFWLHGAGLLVQAGDKYQLAGARKSMREACKECSVEPFEA